ncbi:MAG: DNA internalization-related competence protein ComEC/Rec2 [Clostridiales bacterium]|nr:DNA internalization-related competence protein ComEC/Rec2 [Clostridiales bacterium]
MKRRWAFLAGAVVACLLVSQTYAWWLCLPLGLAGLFYFYIERKAWTAKRYNWFALGVAVMLLWFGLFGIFRVRPAQRLWNQTGTYTAIALDYPGETSWGSQLDVELHTASGAKVRTRIYTSLDCAEVKPGDTLEITATLISPKKAYEDVLTYYTARGIFAVSSKVTALSVTANDEIPLRFLPQAAAKVMQERIEALYSGDAGGVLMALLTGEQDELSDAVGDQLSRTGLRHLVAVSGLHVSLLIGGLLLLPGDRRLKSLLAVPVLLFFCLLTGAGPSVVRATVMGLLALLGPFFRRDSDGPWSLGLALLFLLICNPFSINSVGLQLSFTAVAGIFLVTQPLNRWMLERGPMPTGKVGKGAKRWVCGCVSVTAGATVLTLPISIYYFETISLVAPLANLLVLWSVTLLFGGGLLTLGLSFLSMPLARLLALPVKALFAYFFGVVDVLSRLPYSSLTSHTTSYCLWLVAVYAVLLLLAVRPKWRKRAGLCCVGLVALLALLIWFNRSTLTTGGLTVQVLDVGQGQSVLFLSQQEAVAVDCGGDDAGNVLADALGDVGESSLELLMLTHFDSDHIDGVEQLLERVTVEVIAVPDIADDSDHWAEIEALAEEYQVELMKVTEDTTVSFGSAEIEIFAPVTQEEDDNNGGLSALVWEGTFEVLITGDMDSETELLLAEEKNLSAVNVLVVGHHGSRYSTGEAFLSIVQPETAIISVGANNSYGHPTQETLDRLAAAGCTVYRTDQQGNVTVTASAANGEED